MNPARSYEATRSRDPIWTQVACDPEDGLRTTLNSRDTLRQSPDHSKNVSSTASTASPTRDESSVLINSEKKGLNLYSAAVFVAGEMAGSGVLALPKAIVDTGFIGIFVLIYLCACAAYGGFRLGSCWTILEERFPEHRMQTRNPYATIAYRAAGPRMRQIVSCCIRFTLFGASVVYLLLASQIFHELFRSLAPGTTSCFWFMVIAIFLTIPMWAGSPKEFCAVGVGAILTTAIACAFYFTQMVMDFMNSTEPALHDKHNFSDFFLSFGTLVFAFGGASTFPTIQNDMENKKQFSWSILIAFLVILALYLPITLGGYFVYGEDVTPNVAMTMTKTPLVFVANVLMAIHLLLAFLIVINPVCQELEENYQLPRHFNWKRVVLRSLLVVFMIIIGESIPQFGKILSLVGGSSITLLTFVFPTYFYMKLSDQENPHWPERKIPIHERIFLWELIIIGLVGGVASTFSALRSIFGTEFTKPCYWP